MPYRRRPERILPAIRFEWRCGGGVGHEVLLVPGDERHQPDGRDQRKRYQLDERPYHLPYYLQHHRRRLLCAAAIRLFANVFRLVPHEEPHQRQSEYQHQRAKYQPCDPPVCPDYEGCGERSQYKSAQRGPGGAETEDHPPTTHKPLGENGVNRDQGYAAGRGGHHQSIDEHQEQQTGA